MLSLRRYFDALGNLLTPEPQLFDGLPRITASKYETSTEKRDRALKHLLKANHLNFAILCENRPLPNDLPHVGPFFSLLDWVVVDIWSDLRFSVPDGGDSRATPGIV
jgi:hypothetical protein